MTKEKKERLVSLEELQKKLEHFPEVVKRKEKAAEERKKVRANFQIGLGDLFKKK